MVTKLLPADEAGIAEAAALLRNGQVAAIPTETVYGLAANALDEAAAQKIFEAKGRPGDNPLIVHIASMNTLRKLAADIPPVAIRLAGAFWPGPLTLVLKSTGKVASAVSAGLPTVAIRMPGDERALEVIRRAGIPLAAPSANRSGSPSPTTAAHVMADLAGKIPLVLDGGPAPVGVESTVLSLVEEPLLLRPGFVTREEMEAELGMEIPVSKAVQQPLNEGERPQSPGMMYRHYAPLAKVTLVEGSAEDYKKFLKERAEDGVWALCFTGEAPEGIPAISYGDEGDAASQAAGLFAALRELDERGARTAYAHVPKREGVGLAVYNRLLRAAAFRLVRL